jgi:flagellar motor switch protein FliM
LEPIIGKLSVHFYYSTSAKTTTPENSAAIQYKIETAFVPLKVVLGKTCITVRDLLALSPGDVIPLDKYYRDDLEIMVGQRPKFMGKPGLAGNKMAIQVTRIVEEESDDE